MKADSVTPNAKYEFIYRFFFVVACIGFFVFVVGNLHQINVWDIVDVHGPYCVAAAGALDTMALHSMLTDLHKHVTEPQNLHCVDKSAGVAEAAVAEQPPHTYDVAKC